jgi:hypothetical protein
MSTYDEPVAGLEPLEPGTDHVRGPAGAPVILEYGDYECPYSRLAFRAIEHVERALNGEVRFAYRHYPLMQIHPHALGAAAAEAAANQGRFWDMHDVLFFRQKDLADSDLRRYARELGLIMEEDLAATLDPDVRIGQALAPSRDAISWRSSPRPSCCNGSSVWRRAPVGRRPPGPAARITNTRRGPLTMSRPTLRASRVRRTPSLRRPR